MIDASLAKVNSCDGCSYLKQEFTPQCQRYHIPLSKEEMTGNLHPKGARTQQPTTHFPYCYNSAKEGKA